ncbi:MAG: outer membrane beta-barrel protein [Kiritimatiellae bacterium]|nr:outer membrane beta-barrel protein [Kiritimatiellia bacterium]
MNKSVITIILGFCGVFSIYTMALAQSREGDPVRFSLITSAAFTDNRDSAVDGDSNTDLYLKPRLDGVANWGRGSLVFYYEPSCRYRSDPSDVQNDTELQHDVGLNLEHSPVRRLTFNVQNRFALTDDPAIQKDGATLRRDTSFIINWAGIGSKIDLGKHTRLDMQFEHILKRYDETDVASESDEDSLNTTFTAWQQVTKTLGLFVDVGASVFEYEHTYNIDRNFDSLSGGVGAYKVFGKMLEGNFRLGQKAFSYDDASLVDDEEPYISLDLMIQPVSTFRIKLDASYMLKNSDTFPHASQKYTSFNTRLEVDVTKMLMFGVSAEYRLGEYDIDTVPQEAINRILSNPAGYPSWVQRFVYGGETSGEEKTLMGTIDLAYQIGKNTSIRLAGNYENVKSDVSTTFDRNAVSLALSRAF